MLAARNKQHVHGKPSMLPGSSADPQLSFPLAQMSLAATGPRKHPTLATARPMQIWQVTPAPECGVFS